MSAIATQLFLAIISLGMEQATPTTQPGQTKSVSCIESPSIDKNAIEIWAVQETRTYTHTSPKFSFKIPTGWEEYSKQPTPGVYTKLWRVVDEVFTGSGIRIAGGEVKKEVATIWDLPPTQLKAEFELEYVVRNFRTDKVEISGRRALRFEFDSQISDKGKLIPIKMVGHSFFAQQGGTDYMITALLLSRVFDLAGDNAGYMTVVNSLKFN
jgi:hypothetical protein